MKTSLDTDIVNSAKSVQADNTSYRRDQSPFPIVTYVLSGISDAQRRESKLIELHVISIIDRVLRLPSVFLRE